MLNKMQSLMWRNRLPMATKEPSKTPYINFVFKRIYLKHELGDPHFLLLVSDWNAKIKLSAKCKKIIYSRFIATFTIEKS